MIAVAVAQPQQGIQACAYNLTHIVNPSVIKDTMAMGPALLFSLVFAQWVNKGTICA